VAAETEELEALQRRAQAEIAEAENLTALTAVRARYLGKKGSIAAQLRGIGALPPEQRGPVGASVNNAKQAIEATFGARRDALQAEGQAQKLGRAQLDVTLPGSGPPLGHLHPVTHVMRDMVGFFGSLGFSIEEGPEVDTDYYNFEALNVPAEHPARDEQDTFYLEGGNLLRTHTSNVQVRTMTGRVPPFRFIAPGRVYRHDLSPRHSPMFHQIEGFLVDEQVTFGDLKGVLYAFARHLTGARDVELRFRANFFPFTEPSAEMDYACTLCDKAGCATCGQHGWLEWGGCGMIHPKVLERCEIDPDRYQGFAFGMGIDRTAMLRYDIPQIRLLFDGDVRVLEQI